MSFGIQAALAVAMIASGAAGYERYMLERAIFRARVDVIVMFVGVMWLASVLDGRFGA